MADLKTLTINGTAYNLKDAEARSQLENKAPVASPALTGTPTAPTATSGTNNTQIATTAFVNTAVAGDGTKNINVNKATIKYGNMLYTGTGTDGQAGSSSVNYIPSLWIFNTGITPSDGDIINIKIPVAGVNSGVWLSVDNGTTYYPVATINKTRLTTQYPVNNTLMLVYQKSLVTSIYGTSISGAPKGSTTADYSSDRWCVVNGYDSNTTYSAMSSANMIAGTETTVRGMRADYLKTGLQGILKVTSGDVQLYGTHLTGQVPAVTASDNGKVLRVVSGAWSAVELPSASGVSF